MTVRVWLCVCVYHGQIFKDLDPITWSHVSHVVEVGGVRDQFVPHLWISQHLSGKSSKWTHKTNTPVAQWVELFVHSECSGKPPPLLKSLFLRHPEGKASLVVHAAHHLLPAVVWRLRDDQLIPFCKITTKPQACSHRRLQSTSDAQCYAKLSTVK